MKNMPRKKKVTSLVLCLLSLVLSGAHSQASELVLGRVELADFFFQAVSQEAPWPREELEVKNFSSSPEELRLPIGRPGFEIISNSGDRLLGQRQLSLMITIDGVPQQQVRMRGDLHRYSEVIITSRRLRRNTIISHEDLAVARRDVTMFAHDLIQSKDEAVGRSVTTSLRSGSLLFSRNLKKTALIKRGDLVTIQARHHNLLVSVQGEARNQGAQGDTIRVKNLMSRQIVMARIMESGLVEVDF